MKFKFKIIFTFIAFNAFVLVLYAQSNIVQSANNELKHRNLKAAKTYIDKAAEHPSTSNDYKMWFYRGKVYFAIQTDTILTSVEKDDIDKDAIEKASISFINCLKTDTKKWHTDECNEHLVKCGIELYYKGLKAYNSNEGERAIKIYEYIFDIFPYDKKNNLKRNNISPEILYNNSYYASIKNNNYEKAKYYLQKLIDMNFNDPLIYVYMCRILMEEKDTVNGLNYIEQGKALFEDNNALMNEELNIYITQGKSEELVNKLTDAINARPDFEILYFNRGTLFEKQKKLINAETDYLKALEINPAYFDASYNLGVLYFNKAVIMVAEAEKITDMKKYDSIKIEFDKKFQQALPYLEKSLQLNPDDKNTMMTLKQLYARVGQLEKSKEMKEKLEKL